MQSSFGTISRTAGKTVNCRHFVSRYLNSFIIDDVAFRMVVMPNAKHNLHLRYTKEFLELVENFLLEEGSNN
jgi:hypothetical protein